MPARPTVKQVRYGRGAYRFRARTGPAGFYGALLRDAARAGPGVAALVIAARASPTGD
jgi:hypothetical protein